MCEPRAVDERSVLRIQHIRLHAGLVHGLLPLLQQLLHWLWLLDEHNHFPLSVCFMLFLLLQNISHIYDIVDNFFSLVE